MQALEHASGFARHTHDHVRHGTLTLLAAALDLDTGQVYYAGAPRHRHQEFLAFLRQLARGSFADVADLWTTLGRYVHGRNRQAVLPRWRFSADVLLARIAHGQRICEKVH